MAPPRAVIKLTKSLPFPEAKKQEWIKLARELRRPALVAACKLHEISADNCGNIECMAEAISLKETYPANFVGVAKF